MYRYIDISHGVVLPDVAPVSKRSPFPAGVLRLDDNWFIHFQCHFFFHHDTFSWEGYPDGKRKMVILKVGSGESSFGKWGGGRLLLLLVVICSSPG